MSNPLQRIAGFKKQISSLDYVCSGTLWRRSLVCGQAKCCCKGNPPALHGPYYYWSRRYKGRLTQKVLDRNQAESVTTAIKNYRKVQKILKEWESETVQALKIKQHQKR